MASTTKSTPPKSDVIPVGGTGVQVPRDLAWSSPLDGIQKLVIAPADFQGWAERLRLCRTFERKVVEFFRPLKQKQEEAGKALRDAERLVMARAKADGDAIDLALRACKAEQDRVAREKAREDEKKALEAEQNRRLEEASAHVETARATGDQTFHQAAEATLSAPMVLPAGQVDQAEPLKAAGVSFPDDDYKAEVLSFDTLLDAVIKGTAARTLVLANQKALDGLAKNLKDGFNVPGCRVVRVPRKTTARSL